MHGGARHAAIIGTGSFAPETVVTNRDLERMVDTSDEWIRKRTGIAERRVADEHTASSDLGVKAAERALDAAGISPEDLDLIVCSTVSPDMAFPSTACLISRKLGIEAATPAMDLAAACSGFSYALHVASGLIRAEAYRTVLVVAAETLTRFVDWTDRSTCVLFGDGAGAVVLQATDEPRGVLHSHVGAFSQYANPELLGVVAGGSYRPASEETIRNGDHYIRMQGRDVFKIAVSTMPDIIRHVIAEAGLTPKDIDLFVPHQANIRIIEAFAERLDVSMDRMFINIDRYGNTSSASAALGLDEAIRTGYARPNDTIFIVTFGAGWTWGTNIIRL